MQLARYHDILGKWCGAQVLSQLQNNYLNYLSLNVSLSAKLGLGNFIS